jgi:hypothetical protein
MKRSLSSRVYSNGEENVLCMRNIASYRCKRVTSPTTFFYSNVFPFVDFVLEIDVLVIYQTPLTLN